MASLRKVASLRRNRDHKKIPQKLPQIDTSAQLPRELPPLRDNLHPVLREFEEYEDVQGDTKLKDCGSMEVEMGCEICKVWRGRLDPSYEEEC